MVNLAGDSVWTFIWGNNSACDGLTMRARNRLTTELEKLVRPYCEAAGVRKMEVAFAMAGTTPAPCADHTLSVGIPRRHGASHVC